MGLPGHFFPGRHQQMTEDGKVNKFKGIQHLLSDLRPTRLAMIPGCRHGESLAAALVRSVPSNGKMPHARIEERHDVRLAMGTTSIEAASEDPFGLVWLIRRKDWCL